MAGSIGRTGFREAATSPQRADFRGTPYSFLSVPAGVDMAMDRAAAGIVS
jgi:hypothetical protein